jgi:DNA repair exonuclease SbcCD nuclease subunit
MRKLLHIADLHLGFEHRYLGAHGAARVEETTMTLERLIEWAIDDDNEIAAVLIAGDLFETHDPDARLTGRVVSTLRKLTNSGRTLITIPGNHDEFSYPQSVYRSHTDNWPGHLVTSPQPEKVTEFFLGSYKCSVTAMAYTAGLSPRRLDKLPVDDSEIRIALLHGTLDAEPSDRTYRIDSSALVDGGYAYAALGHIHKPAEYRIGDGLAVYPGTLNGKGFDDPGIGDLVVVSFVSGRPVVEHIPFPVRPIRTEKVGLEHFETQEKLIAALDTPERANQILKLELIGPQPSDFNLPHLTGRLESSCFHLEVDDLSVEISAEQIDRLVHQPTIKGLFTQLMVQKITDLADDEEATELHRLALSKGLVSFARLNKEISP